MELRMAGVESEITYRKPHIQLVHTNSIDSGVNSNVSVEDSVDNTVDKSLDPCETSVTDEEFSLVVKGSQRCDLQLKRSELDSNEAPSARFVKLEEDEEEVDDSSNMLTEDTRTICKNEIDKTSFSIYPLPVFREYKHSKRSRGDCLTSLVPWLPVLCLISLLILACFIIFIMIIIYGVA